MKRVPMQLLQRMRAAHAADMDHAVRAITTAEVMDGMEWHREVGRETAAEVGADVAWAVIDEPFVKASIELDATRVAVLGVVFIARSDGLWDAYTFGGMPGLTDFPSFRARMDAGLRRG